MFTLQLACSSVRRWGELHVCSVGEVVGPPYSLETVAPGSGAITGATEAMVRSLPESIPLGDNQNVDFLLRLLLRGARTIGLVLGNSTVMTYHETENSTPRWFLLFADHGHGLLICIRGRECQVRLSQGLCGSGRTSSERH